MHAFARGLAMSATDVNGWFHFDDVESGPPLDVLVFDPASKAAGELSGIIAGTPGLQVSLVSTATLTVAAPSDVGSDRRS
jgi:hypothetical protein